MNTRILSGLLVAASFLAHPAEGTCQCSEPSVMLTASDGATMDRFGQDVSLDGDVALVGAESADPRGTTSGAAYVFRHDGNGWVEEQKLVGSATAAGDQFGHGVSVSGTVAVVGAVFGERAIGGGGTAYVYRFDGSQWLEEQILRASDGAPDGHFGREVVTDGTWIFAAAPNLGSGAVYAFRHDGVAWVQHQKLTPGGASINTLGWSMSLNGNVLVVSDQGDNLSQGAVYVFEYDGSQWVEVQKIVASDGSTGDSFGTSVSFDSDQMAVGAAQRAGGSIQEGAVYMYRHDGSQWVEQQILVRAKPRSWDQLGWSVSLHGNRLVTGSWRIDTLFVDTGAIHVFEYDGASWVQTQVQFDGEEGTYFGETVCLDGTRALVSALDQNVSGIDAGAVHVMDVSTMPGLFQEQKLLDSDGAARDNFGISVEIDGNRALFGAHFDQEGGVQLGAVSVFGQQGGTWSFRQQLLASDGQVDDVFGWDTALAGDVMVVGAYRDDDLGFESGSAYVFRWDGVQWVEEQKLLASDGEAYDIFGYAVDTDGAAIVVGAHWEDTNGTDAGAAYVFRWDGAAWIEEQKLVASDTATGDFFGSSVAIEGNRLAVGAYCQNGNWSCAGAVYVFEHDGSQWTERQKLVEPASWAGWNHGFGRSVDLDGSALLIGANRSYNGGVRGGAAHLFRYDGTLWSDEQRLFDILGQDDDDFGWDVALDGGRALIGAPSDDGWMGSVHVFEFDGARWRLDERLTASVPDPGDNFGFSVALSGNDALVGAFGDDDDGFEAGAVYACTRAALGLRISPNASLPMFELIQFHACPGLPGGLVFLYATDVNGMPTFLQAWRASFDASGEWNLFALVPPGLSGVTVTFQALGQAADGTAALSNSQVVSFS